LELVALEDENHDRELRTRAISFGLQLRHADLVLCANAAQRAELIAAAARPGRTGRTLDIDPLVVPFGISAVPPPTGRRPLRERFQQIRETDQVVFWWGTVWRWLDAETVIRAFAQIASVRPEIKLVISAGKPPNGNNRRFEATDEAIALARELGLYGSSVLFLDEWISYDDRHEYMAEATIGVTLHRSSREAELAARARYMDYLAAELPCVLGRGDETAADFEAAGYATLLDRPDPGLLASALLGLLDDPDQLAAKRAAGRRLAAERRWSAVGRTLRNAVSDLLEQDRAPTQGTLGLLAATASYYRHRVADEFAEARSHGRKYGAAEGVS
ncbi:MAG: hypothetical protein ACRDL8_23355, partial [Solirubrobacteraceae bacterium]